jgi:phosphonatase-like hydrolase
METLNKHRGRDKRTVINEFGGEKARQIYEHFINMLFANAKKVKEVEGASETFDFLHERGIRIATNTGFPQDVSKAIIENLGWEKAGRIDFWMCSEMVGKSRPDPSMIFETMKYFHIKNPLNVIKVDDTVIGLEEGKRAGVLTLGVLTGSQSREMLQTAKPDDIIPSVKELPNYLKLKKIVKN